MSLSDSELTRYVIVVEDYDGEGSQPNPVYSSRRGK